MIKQIRIENYKSIQKLKLELGRITVLIGENGSGKTNI
ncbi:AAA family ATPase [Anaerolineales bacterium HSG24]|nr:AAA family ATPase [Anaerolineales bacterium HSG24]